MSRLRGDHGSTVVELVFASALFLLLLGGVLAMLDSATRAERGQQSRRDALVELREAMTRITKDLRQALVVADAPGSGHSRLEITTLISGDEHPIVYEVVGGEFRRSLDGGGPTALASGIAVTADPTFCYSFDSVGKTCIDDGGPPSPVTSVRITLARTPDASSGGPITLATDVQLRNLQH
jgi:Tfp pilus assembly protein PilW